ncbi:MAG TPA: PLP-dependent aminotransferase family protein [Bryobacteraceae bacterium]|nr:PLP-dependent aminotransferase family protein [Bryobacteraceae bacterium]
MLPITSLNPESESPLYRQLYGEIRQLIESGRLLKGGRLPATRELAGQLGLNRTTVSAAYELLESEGLITGHVGRGSFVAAAPASATSHVPWREILEPSTPISPAAPTSTPIAGFSSSRPSELLFPLEEFRATCQEVIASEDAQTILQLGSPSGYPPLRRYLLELSRAEGVARETDDILITSGVQQACDLLQRTLIRKGETVLLEDPVYLGMRHVFERGGSRIIGVPVTANGIDLEALEHAIRRERPRLLAVTSNFQNPTGATLPLAARQTLLTMAQASGVIVIENDIYGALAYEGDPIPTLKRLDETGDTILLRSFSKLAFPGLRVGWVIGPRLLIEKLTEAKLWSDLHTDQLSQAVLLRFAESGRLAEHRQRMLEAGRERLHAALSACEKHLPREAKFSRPRGGMSLWVRLPEPLDAGELLPRAEREGVTYLPGKYFAVTRPATNSLRISFAGMAPDQIRSGIAILGRIFTEELERVRAHSPLAEVPAMV